jgi:predicted regulator of Ras-like GTPase activity (Roadblock/LC7/MglB family)
MDKRARTSTEVLEEILKIPGVSAVVVISRDGFVIETAGTTSNIRIDGIGAALATAINSIEEMGQELEIRRFQDMFVEFGGAVIMCKPVGDAVVGIISPDASKLGIIRHKIKKQMDELVEFF